MGVIMVGDRGDGELASVSALLFFTADIAYFKNYSPCLVQWSNIRNSIKGLVLPYCLFRKIGNSSYICICRLPFTAVNLLYVYHLW